MKKIGLILLLSCGGILISSGCFPQVVKAYDSKAALSINNYIRDYSTLPIKPTRTLFFKTDEGSRIHCDISLDGKTLVFTILGELFLLPSGGGAAVQITRGVSVNASPTWSPDGKYIAFISDATGSPHTHIRSIDGKFHKVLNDQLPIPEHDTSIQHYNWQEASGLRAWEPQWLPDGHIIVSNGQIFDLAGNIIALPRNVYHFINRPILGFSSDGRKLFTAEKIGYKDPMVFTIDFKTFDTSDVRSLPTPESREVRNCRVSPDGKYVCFMTHVDGRENNALFADDLSTGKIRLVKSFAEDDTVVVTENVRYAFSSDSKFIYIAYAGKLHRLGIESTEDKIIPFLANVEVDMGPSHLHQFKVRANELQTIRLIRGAQRSEDGKSLVFSALKKIYVKNIVSGNIKVIAEKPGVLYQPVLSPDGKYIAYVSHTDADSMSRIHIIDKGGRDSARTIAMQKGFYTSICWSPDGASLAALLSSNESSRSGLYVIDCASGIATAIRQNPYLEFQRILCFSKDGSKVFCSSHGKLFSIINKAGGKQDCILKIDNDNNKEYDWGETQFSLSPNGKYLVFSYNNDLYLIPVLKLGMPIVLTSKSSNVVRFAIGAFDPHWEKDGKIISWSYGNKYFYTALDQVLTAVEFGKMVKDSLSVLPFKIIDARPKINSIAINLKYSTYHANSAFAFLNARVITMEGNQVIKSGVIVIKDGIIQAVGKSNEVPIPKNIQKIDLNGKSIIPGMLDLHLHTDRGQEMRIEEIPKQNAYFSNGVTTSLDPSSSEDMFAYQDFVEAGLTKGPRYYSVGISVGPDYGVPLANLEEAKNEVKKRAELGAIAIKQYKQQTRLQQQWLLLACNEYGVNMTNEGADLGEEFLEQIKNGTPKIEHIDYGMLAAGVKKDVAVLVKASGIYITATNMVNLGDQGYYYWLKRQPDTSARLKRFDMNTFKRYKHDLENLSTKETDSSWYFQKEYYTHRLFVSGVKIPLGSHGNYPGPGLFYEMWGKILGGYTKLEALKAVTIVGAEGLGLDKYLGSIKPGKIADLLILDSDPLEDIRFNNNILYVLKNGVIYDPNTLDVIDVNNAQAFMKNSSHIKENKVKLPTGTK